MTTMVVLVNLKEGVSPEDDERPTRESYAPAVKAFPRFETGGLTGWTACSPRTTPRLTGTA